jgi:prepilin-type processing-associated H-X9-DG protein
VLIAEGSAIARWLWHEPMSHDFWYNDAKNMASFVDGHVSYIKMYWNPGQGEACWYNPPEGYDYQWSPN